MSDDVRFSPSLITPPSRPYRNIPVSAAFRPPMRWIAGSGALAPASRVVTPCRSSRRVLTHAGVNRRASVGKQHADGRAAAEAARGLDPPTVRVDEVANDRQTEPCPALGARTPCIDAIESLEDPRQMLRGDADA